MLRSKISKEQLNEIDKEITLRELVGLQLNFSDFKRLFSEQYDAQQNKIYLQIDKDFSDLSEEIQETFKYNYSPKDKSIKIKLKNVIIEVREKTSNYSNAEVLVMHFKWKVYYLKTRKVRTIYYDIVFFHNKDNLKWARALIEALKKGGEKDVKDNAI
jgi:hypothetical protein